MSSSRRAAPQATLREGLVVSAHGRHCVVETPEGERVICHPRGKRLTVVVGDRVRWLPSQDEGVIERIDERRNLLYRQDEVRTKSFAANLDQVLILVAAEPEFSEHQLARALIDSPGFQEFGLHHIDPMQLAAYMPDIKPHVAECRFYNCTHLHEPGCGVMAAVESATGAGGISAHRYKIYSDLFAELTGGG